MKKKFLAMLLVLGLMFLLLSGTALADDRGSKSLAVGDSIELSSKGSWPYKWSVSDESIISLELLGTPKTYSYGSRCSVKGLRAGTATVTVEYEELVWEANAKADWFGDYGESVSYHRTDTWTITVGGSGSVETTSSAELVSADPKLTSYGKVGENVAQSITDVGQYNKTLNLMPVKRDGLWGYADKDFKLVIPFQFDKAFPFADFSGKGRAVVQTGEGSCNKYLIDEKGNYIVSSAQERFCVYNNRITGYEVFPTSVKRYDINGKQITFSEYSDLGEKDSSTSEQITIDLTRPTPKPPYYWYIEKRGSDWNFVLNSNPDGETVDLVIKPQAGWELADNYFYEKLLLITKDGKYGAIDQSGKLVIPCVYDTLNNSNGGYLSYKKAGEFGLLENPANPPTSQITTDKTSGSAQTVPTIANANSGHKVGSKVTDLIKSRSSFSGCGLTSVRIGDKWGFVDENDVLVIACKYQRAFWFNDESKLAVVRLDDGKENAIDLQANLILNQNYDDVLVMSWGIKACNKAANGDEIYFYFDLEGNSITKEEYYARY